jgi:GNAT superfamily N-acetyltransferase
LVYYGSGVETMSDAGTGEFVRAWIDSWVVSRGAADPTGESWGWTIDVGQSRQVRRHVLPEPDETAVRKVADGTSVPWTWLKLFAEDDEVRPWVGPEWRFGEPGFLMTCPLVAERPAVPAGYTVTTWARGGVTRVLVRAADGQFAARGQIARGSWSEASAVADQIETAPGHRRRGLGGLVMRTLQNAAHEAGARTGVLVGTTAGRELYTSLGWITRAPMASLWYEPDADAGD